MLHDVGKVGIMESILNKNGPLNPDEWEAMKRHVEYGAKLLEPLRGTESIREMVAHHHEFFDGSGYPDGLGRQPDSAGRANHRHCRRLRHDHLRTNLQESAHPGGSLPGTRTLRQRAVRSRTVRVFISRLRELPNPLIVNPALAQEPEVLQ